MHAFVSNTGYINKQKKTWRGAVADKKGLNIVFVFSLVFRVIVFYEYL